MKPRRHSRFSLGSDRQTGRSYPCVVLPTEAEGNRRSSGRRGSHICRTHGARHRRVTIFELSHKALHSEMNPSPPHPVTVNSISGAAAGVFPNLHVIGWWKKLPRHGEEHADSTQARAITCDLLAQLIELRSSSSYSLRSQDLLLLSVPRARTELEQPGLWFGALVTAGGEQLFSSVVFKCPCNQLNFFYGLVFLLVPALALITLGFILSKKTWKLVTGLCQQKDKVCGSCYRVKSLVNVLFQISTFAFLAPSTWIAVALLNGVFVECAMTGTNMTLFNDHLCKGRKMEKQCVQELPTFPCGKDGQVPKDVRDEVLLTLRAESQIVGWLLIASIFLFYLSLTCLARCFSPVSYLQLKFWRLYTQEESSALDSYSAEHARNSPTVT
ncbi:hypothetical protein WMY93_025682 [Mugilogobius chulae]|uniref:Uncharacterized protein n=1 Tax=Mugilogobius chulae TaxID=88201 RepID=A0AAW0N5M6_9GOBI